MVRQTHHGSGVNFRFCGDIFGRLEIFNEFIWTYMEVCLAAVAQSGHTFYFSSNSQFSIRIQLFGDNSAFEGDDG